MATSTHPTCVLCGQPARFQHTPGVWACEKHASASEDTYMEILDTRTGDYRKTGEGAIMRSPVETWAAFQEAKTLHAPGGGFVLDLYVDENLAGTVELDSRGFQRLTGHPPESPQRYEEYDAAFWQTRESERKDS